jgi:hypothetical protein
MKKLTILLLLTLISCSNLSEEEVDLAGTWKWNSDKDGYIERGHLILNTNKTFEYKVESIIPVEKLGETNDGSFGIWIYENRSICFHPIGNIEDKRCIFNEVEIAMDRISFKLVGFFSRERIYASKTSDRT